MATATKATRTTNERRDIDRKTGAVKTTVLKADGTVWFVKTVKQGGLSNGVWWNSALQSFTQAGGMHGFVGHSCRKNPCRKNRLDAVVEQMLREQGLSDEGIAVWLTSTSGRHLGDAVEGTKSDQQTREAFERFFGDRTAMDDLVEWDCFVRTSEKATDERHDAALAEKLAKGERPKVIQPRHIGVMLDVMAQDAEAKKVA